MPHLIDQTIAGPVRLAGRLKSFNTADDIIVLEYGGKCVTVDISHLDPMPYSTMSQAEVFGTLDSSHVLEAKILQCINHADLAIYARTIPILEAHRIK